MNKNTIKGKFCYDFTGITEFLNMAEKTDPDAVGRGDAGSNRAKWQFGSLGSWKKTEELLKKGLGITSMRRHARNFRDDFRSTKLSEITSKVQSVKRARQFNDCDGDLDLERVLGGNDNYWTRVVRTGKQKVVRLGINCTLSCENSEKEFSKLVALSAVLTEILENLGYGLEIYACFIAYPTGGKHKKKEVNIQFPIKRSGETLDIEQIYSMGLTGLLRDAYFRVEMQIRGDHSGVCRQPSKEMLKLSNIDILVTRSWLNGRESESILSAINTL